MVIKIVMIVIKIFKKLNGLNIFFRFLTEKLKINVLDGYNIVGDGTPQATIPMLTGETKSKKVLFKTLPIIFMKNVLCHHGCLMRY